MLLGVDSAIMYVLFASLLFLYYTVFSITPRGSEMLGEVNILILS